MAGRERRGLGVARLVAAAVALFLVAPAGASGIEMVGPGRGSSACIGDATSVRCTIDTLLACFARAARPLCARIGAEMPDPIPEPRRLEYQIERESEIRPDQITDDLRDVAWFKAGFMLVELQLRACAGDAPDCDGEPWEDLQVYLRQQGSTWRVVHWRAPGDPDVPAQTPDALR